MDERTYARVTDLCARLAGRLSDDVVGIVREHYAAGESYLAESTLLLSLAHEAVGVTGAERALIRATLDDPDNPDLHAVPSIDVAPLTCRFTGGAPGPIEADVALSAEAPRHGGRSLHRAWREPLDGARGGATWLYVLRVAEGTDAMAAFSGVNSRMLGAWPLEVVVEDGPLLPYPAAARRIWALQV